MKLLIFTLLALSLFGSTSFAEDSSAQEGQMSFSSSTPPEEWPVKENFTAGARKATLDTIDSVLGASAQDATKKNVQNSN